MENKETELDKIVPERAKLMIHGKEREIYFNFNVWKQLQREYGKMDVLLPKITEDIQDRPFEVIPHLLFLGLEDKTAVNENEEEVTEENILDEYGLGDVEMISKVLQFAIYGSLPLTDEKKTNKKTAKN